MPAWKDLAAIALAVMLASSAANCAGASPDASGADRARQYVASRCGTVDGSAAFASVWDNVEDAEPVVVHRSTPKGAPFDQIVGARLHVRPTPAVTRELLERGLRCHLLSGTRDEGAAPLRACTSASVESEGDGFAVVLRTASADEAMRLLDQARRSRRAKSP